MMYTLTKTDNEALLRKNVEGSDIGIMGKASNAVSSLDQQVKSSQTKNAGSSGFVTVTASVDVLADMVNESEDVDS